MAKPLTHEDTILTGTYGDREVHLCRCVPAPPGDIQIILLHGVHSSASMAIHNKFRYIAELIAEKGITPWLVETSRMVRNRQDFANDIPAWINKAFHGKTFSQEQEDVFIAIREVIKRSGGKPIWVWGFSLGGIIALSAAAGIHFSTETGRPAIDRVILSGTGFEAYKEADAVMMKLPILSTLHSVISPDMLAGVKTGGIISFRGSEDEIFSESSCLEVLEKINLPPNAKYFHAIDGADHSLRLRYGKTDPGIMKEMVDFIIKTKS